MSPVSSDTQVLGAVVLSILGTNRLDELHPYFEKYGIEHCHADRFYPVEPLMGMIHDIVRDQQAMDSMFDFVSMGIANGLSIPLPPQIDTLEKWLMVFENRYPTLYRGTAIGYVKCEKLSPTPYRLHIRWPWVDDIAYGTVYGMCKRFLPHGMGFAVYYDESGSRVDFGDAETLLHVEWE